MGRLGRAIFNSMETAFVSSAVRECIFIQENHDAIITPFSATTPLLSPSLYSDEVHMIRGAWWGAELSW